MGAFASGSVRVGMKGGVMCKLIAFELKKMLFTKVSLFVNVGVLLLLGAIMASNIAQQITASSVDVQLRGTAAIAQAREMRQTHAGPLTPDRIVEDMAHYRTMAFEKIEPSRLAGLSDAAAFSLMSETYDRDTLARFYDPYYAYLLSPWKTGAQEPYQIAAGIDSNEAAGFYEAVSSKVKGRLDDGGGGGVWVYSDAEREYWMSKQASVETPFEYGYVEGWSDIIDCIGFLVFAVLAVCVTLSSVFAGEYQARTDAILLSSRYGRSRLVVAKIAASFIYTTALFVLATIIVCGVPLAFFGVGGATLPLQNIDLAIPYGLTMVQAVLLEVGLAYLMTLGFAALTLFLSAHMRSALGVFVVDMVLVVLTAMIPSGGNGIIARITDLFPYGAASVSFGSLVSYPFGPLVLDLPSMIVVVYSLVIILCIPLSAASFRRHQVA